MLKNILLIMPPFSMKERYGKGIEKIGTTLPPLGLLYLAAELEKAMSPLVLRRVGGSGMSTPIPMPPEK